MNWLSIGLAALAGGLAALVAQLLVGNPKQRRASYAVAFIVGFVVLNALSKQFILPELNTRHQSQEVEARLLVIPVYQAIKQYDPTTYAKVVNELKIGLKKGESESELIGRTRGYIASLVESRLPWASDDAVVSYVGVMIDEIAELNSKSPNLCYQFLFPQYFGHLNGRKYFSPETQQADLSAFADVIRTSAENAQPVPEESEVLPDLETVMVEFYNSYGEDALLLDNPLTPGIDRGKVCDAVAALYRHILELPESESARILRYMLSSS